MKFKYKKRVISNLNDSVGRPPRKLDADEMLKKISPLAYLSASALAPITTCSDR